MTNDEKANHTSMSACQVFEGYVCLNDKVEQKYSNLLIVGPTRNGMQA